MNLQTGIAVGLGVTNAGVSAFEVLTDRSGILSFVLGSGTLGYGVYRYVTVEKKLESKKNWADDIASSVTGVFGGVQDAVGGIAFGLSHMLLLGGVVVAGVLLYILVPKTTISTSVNGGTIAALLGGGMGIGGSVMTYLAIAEEEEVKKVDDSFIHKFGEEITKDIDKVGKLFSGKLF